MAEDKVITKEWCDQVRKACSDRISERYDSMKELFQSKLKGISEQLELTLVDLQRSLSTGSQKMTDNTNAIADVNTKLSKEVKDLHARIDALGKPNWAVWSMVLVISLAVFSEMLVSWKQLGIIEERMNNSIKVDNHHHDEDDKRFKIFQDKIDKHLGLGNGH